MKILKTTILAALVGMLILSSTARAADVHVTCEAGYVTEFEVNYWDPATAPKSNDYSTAAIMMRSGGFNEIKTKRLSLGYSHTFKIPNNATNIYVRAHTVNLIGATDQIDYYIYTDTKGIGDNVHYTYGTLFDSKLRKRSTGAPSGFEAVATEIETFAEEGVVAIGEGVVYVAEEFADVISEEVLAPMAREIVAQHGEIINEAERSWKAIGQENGQYVKAIEEAINEGDSVKALTAVGNLMANGVGFKKMITDANEANMGSIVFFASGGGGAIVGGDVAGGNAFDIATLVYMARNNGQLPPDNQQAVMSSFTSVGFSVGTSIGGGVNVAVGYDSSSAKDISGPSVDLTVDGSFGIGANATVSWDPSDAMKFAGFTVGVSGGLEVEVSAGVSLATKISSLTVGDIKRMRGY